MNRKSLISLTTAAITVVMASGAQAQEVASKPYSIGPAIEFSGGGTSFGIKGKIGISPQFSVRPMVLFGYTPTVSSATFSQAVTNGINNLSGFSALTPAQQEARVRAISDVPLTDQQADAAAKKLAAALATPVADRTPDQILSIQQAQNAIARYDIETFAKLTPEQQLAQVKLISPAGTTDAQITNAINSLNDILKTPAANRSSDQNTALSQAQAFVRNTNVTAFSTLNSAQQREGFKGFSQTPLTQAEVESTVNGFKEIEAIQKIPAADRTPAQQTALTAYNQAIAFTSNAIAPGFTPGSGTAFGLAATYDFQSADNKLSGYVGPRVMFANGSSKIGNFDTSTSETSIGLLVGADYAVTSDLTAGLSATYNFSKSGNLSVTGPGGFSGSAPVSGSSLDFGVNFAYRF